MTSKIDADTTTRSTLDTLKKTMDCSEVGLSDAIAACLSDETQETQRRSLWTRPLLTPVTKAVEMTCSVCNMGHSCSMGTSSVTVCDPSLPTVGEAVQMIIKGLWSTAEEAAEYLAVAISGIYVRLDGSTMYYGFYGGFAGIPHEFKTVRLATEDR